MKIIWCMVPEIWSVTNRIFFSILDHILPFYLPNNPENQNFEKMKKKKKNTWRYHHFTKYTKNHDHVLYFSCNMAHHRCNHFSFWAFFCPFTPLTARKIKNFQKNEKNYWRYHHFTHVHQKLWSYDVRFLRYGSWDGMDGWTDGRTNRQKKWHVEVGAPPKNISKFVINSATISNLFLMEMRFKWSAMKVLKCSRRFVLILCRSFSKILEDSEMSEDFVVK